MDTKEINYPFVLTHESLNVTEILTTDLSEYFNALNAESALDLATKLEKCNNVS